MSDDRPRVLDRNGWPLHPEMRCRRYSAEGDPLKHKVMITAVHADGQVEFVRMDNLSTGTTLGERLEALKMPKQTPKSVLRYQMDRVVSQEASELLKRRKVTGRK